MRKGVRAGAGRRREPAPLRLSQPQGSAFLTKGSLREEPLRDCCVPHLRAFPGSQGRSLKA